MLNGREIVSIRYLVSGIKYNVSNIIMNYEFWMGWREYQVSGIKYLVLFWILNGMGGSVYQVSGTKYNVLSTKYRVVNGERWSVTSDRETSRGSEGFFRALQNPPRTLRENPLRTLRESLTSKCFLPCGGRRFPYFSKLRPPLVLC